VYKGIEKATGETVAIKHVCFTLRPSPSRIPSSNGSRRRLTWSRAKTTSRRSKLRSPCSAHARAPLSPSTRARFCEDTSYGLSWSIWEVAHALTWFVAFSLEMPLAD